MLNGSPILHQYDEKNTPSRELSDIKFIESKLDHGCVGYICSYPYPGTDYTRADIDTLTAKLKSILDEEGYNYRRGGGVYKGIKNSDSFMVFDISKERLIELGRQFKQDSVIFTQQNQHQCIYLQGDKKGMLCSGKGWEKLAEDTQDNYCFVQLDNDLTVKFITHIDWNNEYQPEYQKPNLKGQL